jgi:hypothetical protein
MHINLSRVIIDNKLRRLSPSRCRRIVDTPWSRASWRLPLREKIRFNRSSRSIATLRSNRLEPKLVQQFKVQKFKARCKSGNFDVLTILKTSKSSLS